MTDNVQREVVFCDLCGFEKSFTDKILNGETHGINKIHGEPSKMNECDENDMKNYNDLVYFSLRNTVLNIEDKLIKQEGPLI
jgi:hypothetical protein